MLEPNPAPQVPLGPEQPSAASLRTRLITGFLAVALLPFLGISFILTVSGAQSGRQTALNQLTTILQYKQSAILIWNASLKAELGNVLQTLSATTPQAAGQPSAGATTAYGGDIQRLLEIAASAPNDPETAALRNSIRGRLQLQLSQSQYFDEFILLDTAGLVVVASNTAREAQYLTRQDYFQQGLLAPYVAPPVYNEAPQRTEIYVSYPVGFHGGQIHGVIVGRATIAVLNNIINQTTGLGETGKTYLVSLGRSSPESGTYQPARILAGLDRQYQGAVISGSAAESPSAGVAAALDALTQPSGPASAPGNFTGRDFLGVPVLGAYLHIPEYQAFLFAEQAQAESGRAILAALAVNASVAVSSILVALFLALLITHGIALPISELSSLARQAAVGSAADPASGRAAAPLAEIARRMAALQNRAASASQTSLSPEIAALASAFSALTARMAALINSLETRVAERTREMQVRSAYLQASTEVSRSTASILDPDQLIENSVELIRMSFNLYYVGIFLADEARQWASLRAGTGEAGRKMLQRRFRLPIPASGGGGPAANPTPAVAAPGVAAASAPASSMIGWAIANAQARIAQVAEDDLVRRANPDLPDTRSEAAIPLRSRGQVIGAISVQSDRPNAFDETAIAVLQSMSDQLAIAIDNAHLFAEAQEALQAERRAFTAQSQTAWSEWLAAQLASDESGSGAITYIATPAGSSRAGRAWSPEMEEAFTQGITVQPATAPRAAVPIKLRGAAIGVLELSGQPGDGQSAVFSAEEIAFLESIADQLAVALDSARLYAETQRKAEQERLVARVTNRLRASLDIETVLKTAAEEIYNIFDLSSPDPAEPGKPAAAKILEHLTIRLTAADASEAAEASPDQERSSGEAAERQDHV